MQLRKIKIIEKKGSIIDIAYLLVAILGIGIFILIVGYVYPQITSQIKGSEVGNNSASVTALASTDNIVSRFDSIFLIIFIGIAISVLITSFFIDSSPILIPVYIIALAILITFAVIAEHVYTGFAENADMAATALNHPITSYILSHLVFVAIGVGVLSMILIFAKPRGTSGGPY